MRRTVFAICLASLWLAPAVRAGTLLYVSDSGNNTVAAFDNAGQRVATISGGLDHPAGIAFGPNGDLFVANSRSTPVSRFSAASGYTTSTTITDGAGNPQGVAVASNGDLFVSYLDFVHNLRYVRDYNAASDYTKSTVIPITGTFPSTPAVVKIGPNGDLFVEDISNSVIDSFSAASGYTSKTVISNTLLRQPSGMTFGPNEDLYVYSSFIGGFVRFTAASDYSAVLSTFTNSQQRGFGATFGPDGDLYLVNSLNSRVSRFTAASGYANSTRITTGLSAPIDVAIGPAPHAAPEPSTLGLACLGGLTLAMFVRRNRAEG
jgi:YVTN family beta-propeller protein